MKFSDFYSLWEAAQSVYTRWDYLVKYDQQYAEAGIVYDMARGGMKTIRAYTGLSQKKFSAEYGGIPLVTYSSWEAGVRTPPQYVPMLLAYAVLCNIDFEIGGTHDGHSD